MIYIWKHHPSIHAEKSANASDCEYQQFTISVCDNRESSVSVTVGLTLLATDSDQIEWYQKLFLKMRFP